MTPDDAPVLILNYGGWDDTMALVARIATECSNIWVIDNKSPVDRGAELIARHPHIHYLPLDKNWGWAGGYNRAIDHVRRRGPIDAVYILNNDALPEPGAIARAIRRLRERPKTAAVGSVMLSGDGRHALFDGLFRNPPINATDVGPDPVTARRIHGGGFALNLAAFDAVGPFHEPYFLYHEESEWCLRAVAAGWSFLVDGSSRVRHDGGASDVNQNRQYYLTRNRYLAFRRGFPLSEHDRSIRAMMEWDYQDMIWQPAVRGAILHGMADGLAGRFGPRQTGRPTLARSLMMARLQLQQVAFRAKHKVRRTLLRAR